MNHTAPLDMYGLPQTQMTLNRFQKIPNQAMQCGPGTPKNRIESSKSVSDLEFFLTPILTLVTYHIQSSNA